jgi:hypothetical protein
MLVEDRRKLLANLLQRFKIRAINSSPLNPVQLVRES